ncbi:hypothetical protein [Inquilinus limosus]|uniref:hypothetical protein n=1 Tax=Inquilinus limosus TaxID=171674 RepID=UPI00119827D7|nr:hypothetical protein [Inquilinus limosus]
MTTTYQYEIACAICGKRVHFTQTWTRRRKTCGRKSCLHELKRRSRLATPNDRYRLEAISCSPLTGPFETHSAAREWSLLSPDGTVYRFKNLSLFIREHADLFDPADTVFNRDGGCNVNVYLGKLRPRSDAPYWQQWRGWRWYHGQ